MRVIKSNQRTGVVSKTVFTCFSYFLIDFYFCIAQLLPGVSILRESILQINILRIVIPDNVL